MWAGIRRQHRLISRRSIARRPGAAWRATRSYVGTWAGTFPGSDTRHVPRIGSEDTYPGSAADDDDRSGGRQRWVG